MAKLVIGTNGSTAAMAIANAAGPRYYIKKTLDANGTLQNSIETADFTGVEDIGNYTMYYANYKSVFTQISWPSLKSVSGNYAMYYCYASSQGITSLNMPNLKTISGNNACAYAFTECDLRQVSLPLLEEITGHYAFYQAFSKNFNMTSFSCPSLKRIKGTGTYNMAYIFYNNASLTNVDFSKLQMVSCVNAFSYAFQGTAITSISFPSLYIIDANNAFNYAFYNCPTLQHIYFPALNANSFGSYSGTQFTNMLKNCTGVTVHFPKNLQNTIGSWSTVTGGFGGTNTTVVYDQGVYVYINVPTGYSASTRKLPINSGQRYCLPEGENEFFVTSSAHVGVLKVNITASMENTTITLDPTQIAYNEFTCLCNKSEAVLNTRVIFPDGSEAIQAPDANSKFYCSSGCIIELFSGTEISGYHSFPVYTSSDTSQTIELVYKQLISEVTYSPADIIASITGDTTYASEDTTNNYFLYHYPTNAIWAGSVQLQLTPPAGTTLIGITTRAYVSSELNYDFGFISLGTARVTPTYTEIKGGTIANGVYLFRQSGTNNTMTPVSYECADPTQTVLTIGWGQDNSLSGTNTMYIEPITVMYF